MENIHPLDLQVAELQTAAELYRFWSRPDWAKFVKCHPPLMRFWFWLAETAIYCTEFANPADELRSSLCRPPLLPRNRFETLWQVHSQRSWAFMRQSLRMPLNMPYEVINRGNLLVYYPDLNLADGAAKDASDGFFDSDNIPPWDTWVDYFEKPLPGQDQSKAGYLISWVPPQFIPAASEGIRVNPEGCIEWLEESETPFKTIWAEVKNTSWA